MGSPPQRGLSDRIQAKIIKGPDCWLWDGAHNDVGRPQVRTQDRGTQYVYRMVWEERHGPIPPTLTIDHLCGNGRCVRVDHLEVVTMQENQRRHVESRTTCARGHAYSPENTYVRPDNGTRTCRACRVLRDRARAQARTSGTS